MKEGSQRVASLVRWVRLRPSLGRVVRESAFALRGRSFAQKVLYKGGRPAQHFGLRVLKNDLPEGQEDD